MNPFEATLSPNQLGAEILARIARERLSGNLVWSESGGEFNIEFSTGRPQSADIAGTAMEEREQIIGVVRGFAVVTSGRCNFFPGEVEERNLRIDTLGETLVALLRDLRPAQLDAVWRARAGDTVDTTPLFDQLTGASQKLGLPALRRPLPNTTIASLVAGADVPSQRAWVAQLVLGGFVITRKAPSQATPVVRAPPSRPVEVAPAPISAPAAVAVPEVSAEKKRLISEIDAMVARLETMSHYELLGVDRKAAEEAIRKAYLQSAKKWHTDAHRAMGIDGAHLAKVELIFQSVEEANRVLCDKDQRTSYDFRLDRHAQGLPTDPRVIMEAEGIFRKAETLIRRGQAGAAEPLLRQAVTMNKGEAEFWIYLGFAVHAAKGHDGLAEARELIKKGMQMNPKLDAGHEFLGRIARVEGDNGLAQKELQMALEMNPKNVEAERELRLLARRQTVEHDKQKSGLAGLFGKLKK